MAFHVLLKNYSLTLAVNSQVNLVIPQLYHKLHQVHRNQKSGTNSILCILFFISK